MNVSRNLLILLLVLCVTTPTPLLSQERRDPPVPFSDTAPEETPPKKFRKQQGEEYLARSERTEQWLLKTLPKHIKGDLRELYTDPWIILGTGAATAGIAFLHKADERTEQKFQSAPVGSAINKATNLMGNPFILGGLSVISLATFKLLQYEKTTLTLGTITEALALNEMATQSLKFATNRTRPDGDSRGFPSGHTSRLFTVASVLQARHGWKAGLPAYALAGLVGVGRLNANQHHLTDVLAGALIGTLIGLGTGRFHNKEATRLLVQPHFGDNQTGLMIGTRF